MNANLGHGNKVKSKIILSRLKTISINLIPPLEYEKCIGPSNICEVRN